MQVAGGRFGGNNSGYMDLDALYGLKYMRSLAPTYRTTDINNAVTTFGQWLNGNSSSFLAGNPTMHEVLAKVGGFGLLNQLSPTQFPDSTGVHWTDIFTDQKLYQTAAVETFAIQSPTRLATIRPSLYSSVVLGDAPVGYWRLGQTGGITASEETGKAALRGTYIGLGTGSGPAIWLSPGMRPSAGYEGLAADNRAAHLNGTNKLRYRAGLRRPGSHRRADDGSLDQARFAADRQWRHRRQIHRIGKSAFVLAVREWAGHGERRAGDGPLARWHVHQRRQPGRTPTRCRSTNGCTSSARFSPASR